MLLAHPTESLRFSRGFFSRLCHVWPAVEITVEWLGFILSCCFPCTDMLLDIAIKERISNLACSQAVFFTFLPQLKPSSPLLTMLRAHHFSAVALFSPRPSIPLSIEEQYECLHVPAHSLKILPPGSIAVSCTIYSCLSSWQYQYPQRHSLASSSKALFPCWSATTLPWSCLHPDTVMTSICTRFMIRFSTIPIAGLFCVLFLILWIDNKLGPSILRSLCSLSLHPYFIPHPVQVCGSIRMSTPCQTLSLPSVLTLSSSFSPSQQSPSSD